MNKLSVETSAYLAGLFDGEGSIFVAIGRRPGKKDEYLTSCDICNTDKEAMQTIYSLFGTGRLIREPQGQGFHWRLQKKEDILDFLRAIRPWLIIKAKKADIMIQFCERRLAKYKARNGFDKSSYGYDERDIELINQLRGNPIPNAIKEEKNG